MRVGDVIAERFVLEAELAVGGMATVYRALDRSTSNRVAVKVGLFEHRAKERFEREAMLLTELRHPGLVRCLDRGTTCDGLPFIVLEWLEGEDLEARLFRGRLPLGEALELARMVAAALAPAHRRGVVHRDLKPSNVFLSGGLPGHPKLLDFGVAYVPGTTAITREGIILGTAPYMAPEQVRGEGPLDPRADVFGLGCLLYRCLLGVPAFEGVTVMATFSKVLFDDPPPPSLIDPRIPPAVDQLVMRMLAKEPEDRFPDGDAVARAIDVLEREVRPLTSPPPPVETDALTHRERELVCLVLAHDRHRSTGELREALGGDVPGDARIEILSDGTLAVLLRGRADARDQTVDGARIALRVREALPAASVVICTGRAEIGQAPVGEVIDRAARLVEQPTTAAVRIDELSTRLLPPRFVVERTGAHALLRGERELAAPTRRLLGRDIPFVGRERELEMVMGLAGRCLDGGEAGGVLLVGEPGVGKSRIRQELVARLERGDPTPAVWMARGDPMRTSSTYGLLAHALRRVLGLVAGDSPEECRRRLVERVGHRVAPDRVARVAAFVGEVVGCYFPDDATEALAAARREARMMGDLTRLAVCDFVEAEVRAQPLVLVLEDLHWADLATLKLVDAILDRVEQLPFLLVGVARPELRERFPGIWERRPVQAVRVAPLSRRGCGELVRAVVGEALDDDIVATLITASNGNAFFLEELVRAHARGELATGELPRSVIAMVEARIGSMEVEARRVLRAASVFGEVFWRDGVAALVSSDASGPLQSIDEWLDELVEREIVRRRWDSKLAGQVEYAFRHSLLREGAYATLTDEDRRAGHRLAGLWLEEAGSSDAAMLAEHHQLGEAPERAIRWWAQAAEDALDADDLSAALLCADCGIDDGATGDLRVRLLLAQAETRFFQGDRTGMQTAGDEALELTETGSLAWWKAMAYAWVGALMAADLDRADELGVVLVEAARAAEPSEQIAMDLIRAGGAARTYGRRVEARVLSEVIERWMEDGFITEHATVSHAYYQRALAALYQGDLGSYLRWIRESLRRAQLRGLERAVVDRYVHMGYALLELGRYPEAEQALYSAAKMTRRLGLDYLRAVALHNLGLVQARLGRIDEGLRTERKAIRLLTKQDSQRLLGSARLYLASIHLMAGDTTSAEEEASSVAGELGETLPPLRARALARVALARIRSGRTAEGLSTALEAARLAEELGGLETEQSLVHIAVIEALEAAGETARRAEVLEVAHAELMGRATLIESEEDRRSFLTGVPAHAAIMSRVDGA